MRLFKADLYRFFAFGFAGGAVLVFGVMGLNGQSLADSVVPPAHAAAQQR